MRGAQNDRGHDQTQTEAGSGCPAVGRSVSSPSWGVATLPPEPPLRVGGREGLDSGQWNRKQNEDAISRPKLFRCGCLPCLSFFPPASRTQIVTGNM